MNAAKVIDDDTPAIVESSGRECSKGEFASTCNRLAHALRAAGLGNGDVIAVLAPNCVEYLIAYKAAMDAGMYFVPVNWHLAAPEIEYILRDSGAKILIAHEQTAPVLFEIAESHGLSPDILLSLGNVPGFTALEDFIAQQPDSPPESVERGSVLRYTSATTGLPKAVKRKRAAASLDKGTHTRMQAATNPTAERLNVHLCNSKLYHTPVLILTATELDAGHLVVLMTGSWDPESALQLIETYKVTTTFMVPTMFVRLLKLPAEMRSKYDLSSLRQVLHAASPCPIEIKRSMIKWLGPVLWERYGSVEGPVTLVDSVDWLRYPGTVGRPEAGIAIKILDDHGQELTAGQVGTVYIRSLPAFEFEYRGDIEKTLANRCGEYYTVGDVGYVNDAGFLFLCDRKIDMIISGGVNIYSAEIEQALVLHPAVADCGVFGVPDEIFGETPFAVVQLVPGTHATPSLTAEILAFLGKQVAKMKLPKHIDYVSELPRDPNGKLYKRFLRERYASQELLR